MRRLIAAFALAVPGLMFTGPGADAHALLAASQPSAGALVAKPPTVVVLTFTEQPDMSLSTVHVLDNAGRPVEKGAAFVVGGQRNTIGVAVRSLDRGTYTVTWRTTSADDGHTTAGSFAFGVGVKPIGAAVQHVPAAPGPSVLSVMARWLLYLGLAALLGAAVSGARRRVWIAWLVALAGSGLLAAETMRTSGAGVRRLLTTTTGDKLLFEIGAVAVCGLCVFAVGRWPNRRSLAALGATSAVAMLARARAGHAAASSIPWLTIATQWAHLVAVGVWIGALPWLVGALRGSATPADRLSAARRFSRIATVALVVVVATGTARAISEVGSWQGLLHTSFGVVLLVKLALVAVVIALGAGNRFRHLADAGARLRRWATFEALGAAGVLLVTGILAGYTPAATLAAAQPRVTSVVVTGNDFGTTTKARLTVTPGGVGPNHFVVRVTDFDTGRPVRATTVSLRLAADGRPEIPAATLPLAPGGGGWAADSPVLAVNGMWHVTVVVQTDAGGIEVPLRLQTRQPPAHITAERTPGLPTIYTIAIGSARVQTYVDPGKAGKNDVHFTYLDVAGQPVDIGVERITARTAGGLARELDVRKLDVGHYVANSDLTRGKWTFTAVSSDGLRATLTETVR